MAISVLGVSRHIIVKVGDAESELIAARLAKSTASGTMQVWAFFPTTPSNQKTARWRRWSLTHGAWSVEELSGDPFNSAASPFDW